MANGGGQAPHGLFHAKAGWWNAVLVFVVAVSSLTSAGVLRAQLTDSVLAQVTPLTVSMSSPAPGTTVSGIVTLVANTNQVAESVNAIMNGGTLHFTLVSGSQGNQWQATWHTSAMANGPFTFQLRAMKSGTVVEVPATYNISNQTTTGSTGTSGTTSNTGTTSTTSGTTNTTTTTTTTTTSSAANLPLTVSLSSPRAGSTVSGSVSLVAETNQAAESVGAIMNGGTLPFTVVAGSQNMKWQATWYTGAMSNGTFSFLLRAAKPGVIAEGTATFNIFNQTTTTDAAGSGTTAGSTTNGTGTTAGTTTTSNTNTATNSTTTVTPPPLDSSTIAPSTTSTTTTTTTTTVQPTATLGVQIAAPAAGSTHSSKTVELAAKAAGVPTAAGFRVGKRDGSLLSTLRATLDAGRQLWVAAWDLTQVVNGEYLLEAFVSNSSQSVNSAKVAISILKPTTTTTTTTATPLTNTTVPTANTVSPSPTTTATIEPTSAAAETSAGTAVASTQVAVRVVHPTAGLVLRDTIELAARVSATVRGLGFSLAGDGTSAAGQSGVNAIFDQARQLWVAKWDSRSVSDGAYVIGATARVTDTSFVASENRVSVSIKNISTPTTNLLPPTETTVTQLPLTPPTGAEPSRDGLTNVTQPSSPTGTEAGDITSETTANVATPTAPKFLEIIQPQPGPVRGALPILVNAAEGAVKVVLTIAKPNLREGSMTLNAFYSSGKRMWTSLWNSYFGDEGEYLITAEAAFNDGSSLRSKPVPVRVTKNQPTTSSTPESGTIVGSTPESGRPPATGTADNTAGQSVGTAADQSQSTFQIAATPQITSLVAPETVRQTIKEVPQGTTVLISREISSEAGTAARKEVNDACVAANIPPEKCNDWLASRRGQQNECHAAGIVTKEECVAFMQKKYDGRPPACVGLSVEDCAKVMARAGASLISTKELKGLENAIVPRIGTVLRLGSSDASAPFKIDSSLPSGEPVGDAQDVAAVPTEGQAGTEPLPSEKPKTLADYVPFRQDFEASVRVVASPLYAQSEGDSASSQVPAVLMIDSDEDGLTDDMEERLGTFPGNPDSDSDGFSDGDEIKNGTDPSNEAADAPAPQIAPVDIAILSGLPLEQPKVSGEVSSDLTVASVTNQVGATPNEKTPLKLTGKAKPGEIVTIYIYSYLPVVLTTTAGADGTWSYDLDQPLADGQHEAYVAITDETGKIQGKSNPLAFFVNEAKAATAEEYFAGDAQVTVQEPVNTLFKYYIIGAALLLLLAAGLGWSIFRGRGGSSGIDTASFS